MSFQRLEAVFAIIVSFNLISSVTILADEIKDSKEDNFTETSSSSPQLDKDKNKIRPYEFQFNIEGYQHRQEKKDKKGLINGEYGFVTGDGIYHTTVYATDNEGHFKIINMKNLYVGLPDEKSGESNVESMIGMTVDEIIMNQIANMKPVTEEVEAPLATTATVSSDKPVESTEMESLISIGDTTDPDSPETIIPEMESSVTSEAEQLTGETTLVPSSQPLIANQSAEQSQEIESTEQDMMMDEMTEQEQQAAQEARPQTEKPSVFMQMVENIKQSEKDSKMPNKESMITHNELLNLLYKFNYTLDHHGHHEYGYKTGTKSGEYYTKGRSNSRGYRVKYKANEFGYQPNITFTHHKQQDDSKENRFRGQEFKWFYRR